MTGEGGRSGRGCLWRCYAPPLPSGRHIQGIVPPCWLTRQGWQYVPQSSSPSGSARQAPPKGSTGDTQEYEEIGARPLETAHQEFRHFIALAALIAAVLTVTSNVHAQEEAHDTLFVTGYDATTKQWTMRLDTVVDNRGTHLVKRLVVICSLYHIGNETRRGPDACRLQVGQRIVKNLMRYENFDDFVDIWEMPFSPPVLAIATGHLGTSSYVSQQFDILRSEVVHDTAE